MSWRVSEEFAYVVYLPTWCICRRGVSADVVIALSSRAAEWVTCHQDHQPDRL